MGVEGGGREKKVEKKKVRKAEKRRWRIELKEKY